MKRWLALFVAWFCWMTTGFALLGSTGNHYRKHAGPGRADRIVSLAPNLTEIIFALGLGDKIVGVTVFSDYPVAATEKPKVGTFWQPNIEAVIGARPDLVVTQQFRQQKDTARRLERIGYNCLTVRTQKLSELFDAIETIGQATGKKPQASALLRQIKTRLGELSASMQSHEKPKVLWVINREPLRVAGRDTFVNEIIELAGGENAIGPTVYKYPPIGAEQVIACGAEVIIEPAMTAKSIAEQQQQARRYWSRFDNVPAVAHNRIYVIPPATVCRLGPRICRGVETVARCIRPELLVD